MVRQASLPVLAPFLAAVPCLAAALLVITSHWPENFGNSGDSLLQMYKEGVSFIISDYNILKIGLVQATVESSMFIFVYLWTPTLSAVTTNTKLDFASYNSLSSGSIFGASWNNLLDLHDLDNARLVPLQAPDLLRPGAGAGAGLCGAPLPALPSRGRTHG